MRGKPLYIRSARRPVRRTGGGRIATIAFVALAILANYFVFFTGDDTAPVPPNSVKTGEKGSDVSTPPAAPTTTPGAVQPDATPTTEEEHNQVYAGVLRSGDRMLGSLDKLGLDRKESRKVVRAMERVFDFRNARVGDKYRLQVNTAGRVDAFEYERSPVEIYDVVRTGDEYAAVRRNIVTEVEVTGFGCVVRGDFRRSLLQCARDAELADKVTAQLRWSVDVAAETRDGDELRVLVEKVLADGRFLNYGDILAVDYRGKFGNHRLYRHESASKDGTTVASFYGPDGVTAERRFLRSPLKLSGDRAYTNGAVRPSLHRFKRHIGLDYPVVKGSPVVAVASGTIGHAGPKGSSGTLVAVRHGRGAVSYYAHLSRLAPGLRKGSRVSQGDIIGWTGASGRTNGPRLHYALKKNGKFVNPTEHDGEAVGELPKGQRAQFAETTEELDRILQTLDVHDPELDS